MAKGSSLNKKGTIKEGILEQQDRRKNNRMSKIMNKLHRLLFSHFDFSITFLFFKHLYWSIIALQCCVSCCSITKWISYMYTYIPISPPSCISLPHSISHPSRWTQSTELISLCYAAASHQLAILHLVLYICPCHSLTSSQLTLPPPCVLRSILYLCVFIPVLPLGSS